MKIPNLEYQAQFFEPFLFIKNLISPQAWKVGGEVLCSSRRVANQIRGIASS